MSSTRIDQATYRIVDANLDRVAEGLRVAMDLVRFALDDEAGSLRFRQLRHEILALAEQLPRLSARRLECRDSEADVGRALGRGDAGRRPEKVFSANVHRAQEGLRVLEELARGFGPGVADGFNRARYALYSLEKEYQPRIDRWGGCARLDFELYVVTGPELSRGRSLEEVTASALKGGAGCVQLRAKGLGKRPLLKAAREMRRLTEDAGATLIINDHLDIALAAGADGVHLGQDDLPIPEARRLAGPALLLGASTHTLEQALEAEREGADYINVGPVFPTQTKQGGSPPVGPALITRVKAEVRTPQTCMGGIHLGNVREVVLAGADRVAVVSAVVAAEDIEQAARALVDEIHRAKEERSQRQAKAAAGGSGQNSPAD